MIGKLVISYWLILAVADCLFSNRKNWSMNVVVLEKKHLTFKEFEYDFLNKEDEWKYELVDGFVEKSARTITQQYFYLLANLRTCFEHLKANGKIAGHLGVSVYAEILENIHRIPDVAYYSLPQTVKMAAGENQTPEFVIEVISKTDNINRVNKKMRNYREAKVAVVWHIFPELEEVHVYNGLNMTTLSGDNICSAAPTLPDFKISVNDIFKIPTT